MSADLAPTALDRRVRRRQTVQLLAAVALVVVAALVCSGVVRGLAPDAPVDVPLAVVLALVLVAGGIGAAVPEVRRSSRQVLGVCARLAALTGLVLACVLGAVLALGRAPVGSERALLGPAFLAVGLAAALSGPVGSAVERALARRWRSRTRSPSEVLDAFAAGAGDGTAGADDDELLRQLAEALARTTGARAVEIWTETPDGLGRALSLPTRTGGVDVIGRDEAAVLGGADVAGSAWLRLWLPGLLEGREPEIRLAPATHGRGVLGLVVLERAADDPPFLPSDERTLAEVAARLGVVLHNRELDSALQATLLDLQRTNEELRASRARLVATADRERRRLERDLHDGAQQHLVALAVNLGLVRQLVDDDPATARELLDETADAVRETVQQLRDLAHGIYPPLLMDAGVGEAVRAASARSPLPVSVHVDGLGRYPTEIEAAVYFCCLEALQNAAKHAPDATVRVGLTHRHGDGEQLEFEVVDDGPGLHATARAGDDTGGGSSQGRGTVGQGLQNMADRVGAVGGTVTWDEVPTGGTRVRGVIPLTAPRTPAAGAESPSRPLQRAGDGARRAEPTPPTLPTAPAGPTA